MNPASSVPSDRAAELRQAFDSAFAEPIATRDRDTADFISIRLGADAHAIRMAEIAGLYSAVTVTRVPSPIAELIGIASFRGALTPVYDLAALLGYPAAGGRWVVLEATRSMALAFDEFEDHFRIEVDAVVARQGEAAAGHIHQIARQAGRAWPVIDIPSILATIKQRMPRTAIDKE